MAECYPQGCPPCTEEISFPENPINGQRECFVVGKEPVTNENIQKCWVYDHCIPGWRAEGPTQSPTQFIGGVDLTKTQSNQNIQISSPTGNVNYNFNNKEAGDYFIVEVASDDVPPTLAQDFLDTNWNGLQHPVPVGSFIMWSGDHWVEIPRPFDTLEDSISDLEARIVILETENADLKFKVTTLETKVATLETKVGELETKSADFETRISALENP